MAIFDLYSKRKQDQSQAGQADTYQYDDIPRALRNQIRKIVTDGLGLPTKYYAGRTHENSAYKTIQDILCREYGLDNLGSGSKPYPDLMYFIDNCPTDRLLDVLEISCRMIDNVVGKQSASTLEFWERTEDSEGLLEEVNYRLRRAGIGYQYDGGLIVRVDSQFLHAEVTKPALSLLAVRGYEGPQQEFLAAHDHFRQGRFKEAITEAAKSFESLMKAICERKCWEYPKGARASDLLKVLRKNHLWPDYLDTSFDQLVATLQSGLPQVRNDDAAHGQGSTPREVPEHIAAYALHLAASKIVLLADAAAAIPDVTGVERATESVQAG